jgi:DNA-binding MltR family transcriptional regulator
MMAADKGKSEPRHRVETMRKDIDALALALIDKSDTICAVLVASWIDAALFALLAEFFISGTNNGKTMMNENGPFGMLKAKGDLAYCLGLISESARENVELIGKIRNKFAHRLHMKFSTKEVSDLCDKLIIPQYQFGLMSLDPETQKQLLEGATTPRGKYTTVGRTLAISLFVAVSNARHLPVVANDPWSPTYKPPISQAHTGGQAQPQ